MARSHAALSSRLLDAASLAQSDEPPETCDLSQVTHAAIDAANAEAEARARRGRVSLLPMYADGVAASIRVAAFLLACALWAAGTSLPMLDPLHLREAPRQ